MRIWMQMLILINSDSFMLKVFRSGICRQYIPGRIRMNESVGLKQPECNERHCFLVFPVLCLMMNDELEFFHGFCFNSCSTKPIIAHTENRAWSQAYRHPEHMIRKCHMEVTNSTATGEVASINLPTPWPRLKRGQTSSEQEIEFNLHLVQTAQGREWMS